MSLTKKRPFDISIKMFRIKNSFSIICAVIFLFILAAYSYAELSSDEKDRYDSFVKKLKYNPDDIQAGDSLRELCRKKKIVVQCIDTFNELVSLHPKNKYIRYHAALAYIDEVPGHNLFKKGWYSTRSMDHMNILLEKNPNDWSAYYIRGLNGIYWPVSFRRISKAIEDLKTCVSLHKEMPNGLRKPYHVLAYIALGDAYVKNNNLERAKDIYQQGASLMPSIRLQERLEMSDKELIGYIKEFRNADNPVDTDISFLVDGGNNRL